jgi:hypothetical protein
MTLSLPWLRGVMLDDESSHRFWILGQGSRTLDSEATTDVMVMLAFRVGEALQLSENESSDLMADTLTALDFEAAKVASPGEQSALVQRACSVLWRALLERGRAEHPGGERGRAEHQEGDEIQDIPEIPEALLRPEGPTHEEQKAMRMCAVDSVIEMMFNTVVCRLTTTRLTTTRLTTTRVGPPNEGELDLEDGDLRTLLRFIRRPLVETTIQMYNDAVAAQRGRAMAYMLGGTPRGALPDLAPSAIPGVFRRIGHLVEAYIRRMTRKGCPPSAEDVLAASRAARKCGGALALGFEGGGL